MIPTLALLIVLPLSLQEQSYNPFDHLKKGDWILYNMRADKTLTMKIRKEVLRVEGTKITERMTTTYFMNGQTFGSPKVSTSTFDTRKDKAEQGYKFEETSLTIKGTKRKCLKHTITGVTNYICKEVPYGVVKRVQSGVVTLEAIDWGRAKTK